MREAFVERVFAAARLRALLAVARELMEFHARHKLQLLAHDPARYRSLGRVVASGGPGYRELFLAALASGVTPGRNANALLHAYSRIGRSLAEPLRADLVARIDAYRRGEVPLSVPVALLAASPAGSAVTALPRGHFLFSYRLARPAANVGSARRRSPSYPPPRLGGRGMKPPVRAAAR